MQRDEAMRVIGGWYQAPDGGRRPAAAAAILSAAAHVALIAAFIGGSGPVEFEEPEPGFMPVFYLPPPDRPIPELGSGERVRYVALAGVADESDRAAAAVRDAGSGADPLILEEAGVAEEEEEPVYTVVEVHEEAVRVATSAAPAYPAQLLADGIEGMVVVRYVVEPNGLADVSSLRIVSTTHREFAEAVRAALPHMRFTPARIDDRPVRQLVEQPFSFRIQRPVPQDTTSSD